MTEKRSYRERLAGMTTRLIEEDDKRRRAAEEGSALLLEALRKLAA